MYFILVLTEIIADNECLRQFMQLCHCNRGRGQPLPPEDAGKKRHGHSPRGGGDLNQFPPSGNIHVIRYSHKRTFIRSGTSRQFAQYSQQVFCPLQLNVQELITLQQRSILGGLFCFLKEQRESIDHFKYCRYIQHVSRMEHGLTEQCCMIERRHVYLPACARISEIHTQKNILKTYLRTYCIYSGNRMSSDIL